MPEKRPFERLPADVSPINYSLCLKPDLLDFTFEGKLEAAAQVRRPSDAGGELPGKRLGRARGLGWGPGPAGGRAWPLRAWVWGRPAWGPARPSGAAGGRPGGCALPCWARTRASLRGAPREPTAHLCGVPPDPGPSRLASVVGEAGGCWGGQRSHQSLRSAS